MSKEVEVKPLTGENELLESVTVKDATIESQRLADGNVDLVGEVQKLNGEMVTTTKRIVNALESDKSKETEKSKEVAEKEDKQPEEKDEINSPEEER